MRSYTRARSFTAKELAGVCLFMSADVFNSHHREQVIVAMQAREEALLVMVWAALLVPVGAQVATALVVVMGAALLVVLPEGTQLVVVGPSLEVLAVGAVQLLVMVGE